MSLPQTNATLTVVSQDGSTPDWNTAGSSPTVMWTGSASAYVQEKIRKNYSQSAGALEATKDLQIVLDSRLANSIGINTGQVLTFTWRGQSISRRVMEYNGADMSGVRNYRRFHLNPESIETVNASDE